MEVLALLYVILTQLHLRIPSSILEAPSRGDTASLKTTLLWKCTLFEFLKCNYLPIHKIFLSKINSKNSIKCWCIKKLCSSIPHMFQVFEKRSSQVSCGKCLVLSMYVSLTFCEAANSIWSSYQFSHHTTSHKLRHGRTITKIIHSSY